MTSSRSSSQIKDNCFDKTPYLPPLYAYGSFSQCSYAGGTYEMESIMCIDFSYIVRSIFYLVGVGSKLKESQT